MGNSCARASRSSRGSRGFVTYFLPHRAGVALTLVSALASAFARQRSGRRRRGHRSLARGHVGASLRDGAAAPAALDATAARVTRDILTTLEHLR